MKVSVDLNVNTKKVLKFINMLYLYDLKESSEQDDEAMIESFTKLLHSSSVSIYVGNKNKRKEK